MPGDLITQGDAARLKGVAMATLAQWVHRGRLRSFELYGRRLVSRADVLAYKPAKGGRPRKAAGAKQPAKRRGKKVA